jgi:ABC-type multidrug transport system fused ATPase/permease subunit
MKKVCVWIVLQLARDFTILKAAAATYVCQFAHRNIMQAFHAHILNLSMDFHRAEPSSELLAALEPCGAFSNIIQELASNLISPLVDLFVATIYLYRTNSGHSVLVKLFLTISYLSVAHQGSSWTSELFRHHVILDRRMTHFLQESIQHYRVTSLFNRQESEVNAFSGILHEFLSAQFQHHKGYYLVANIRRILLRLGLLVAASIFTAEAVKGASSPGNFISLVSYWSSISDTLTELATTYKDIGERLVSIEKLIQIFHKQPTVVNGSKQLQIRAGDISFDRVSFSYDSEHMVIHNITFTVPGGSTVAIVGESGSGKSTLANLLLRTDDVKEGAIKIDNQDIRDVTLSSLREQIGITPQNIEVFDRSIMENVRFGRPEASDEDIFEVCNAVGLHDGIMKFPEKYETQVGERGTALSGGQCQLIGIARVMLKRPKLIVLDEPTSAVDSRTEIHILKAFRNLYRGHTKLIIAHRLSTIKDADLILVLHDGSIVERGSHAELLEQRGRYSELWSLHMSPEVN